MSEHKPNKTIYLQPSMKPETTWRVDKQYDRDGIQKIYKMCTSNTSTFDYDAWYIVKCILEPKDKTDDC